MKSSKKTKRILVKSTCQLGSFNNCPGEKEFFKDVPTELIFVDVQGEDCWQNGEDTAVFVLPKPTSKTIFVKWLMFVSGLCMDEFDIIKVGGKIIVRMWWD